MSGPDNMHEILDLRVESLERPSAHSWVLHKTQLSQPSFSNYERVCLLED